MAGALVVCSPSVGFKERDSMFAKSRYHLRSVGGGEITLAGGSEIGPSERASTVSDASVRAALFDALDDGGECRRLAAFLDGLGLGRYGALAVDRALLIDAVDHARTSRRLVAYEVPRRRVIQYLETPVAPLGPEAEPTSWIEVLLVDDDGEPVPDEPYKIEDPAGRVWTGTTNASGMTRIEGIDPGTCKVSFPSLLPRDWKKAG